MAIRVYRRAVLSRVDSQDMALGIAEACAICNPEGEYAVEYTPVASQPEQWRVIKISEVTEGTPDVHPRCKEIREGFSGQIRDGWDDLHTGW